MPLGRKPASTLDHLECARCGRTFEADVAAQTCECGSPLLARYDMEAAASLTRRAVRSRPDTLWRFRELLPVKNDACIVSLGERSTPIIELPRLGARLGLRRLLLKDEGLLPGGSFKARGAAVGVSRAKELGVSALALPTNGNAGVAWAHYAARAGIRATVVMPSAAPPAFRRHCLRAGAHVSLVEGSIRDAGRTVTELVARDRLYDASTLKEPYRIEGKKTLGFEIAEQLEWTLPDVIVYPTGGGVGLIGMHKAFAELQQIGLLRKALPRFIAVQSSGCAPIVSAWSRGETVSTAWTNPDTVAFGINVPKALGDFLILSILRETAGSAVAVEDPAILEHQEMLSAREGVSACPEGGATLAAVAALVERGEIAKSESVLLINTASGFSPVDVRLVPKQAASSAPMKVKSNLT